MRFTDLFLRRPVLATVVNLIILVLGLRALFGLPVSQYPQTQNAVVTIATSYYGADAQTVAGFITQPLEAAIAQAQGIDYLSSNSLMGASVITATLRLNYDASRALTEINTQVNSVRNQLPPQAQQPVLSVQMGQTVDAMYMGFYSETLPTSNVTDFLLREIKPTLDSVEGVQTAELLGARNFALRAWLDQNRMAANGVTAADVSAALAANNYLTSAGATKGQAVTVDLTAGTDLHSVEEFKRLVVKQTGLGLVHLEDVADVTLGSDNYDFNVAFDGQKSVFIGIKVAPNANVLEVAERVRKAFPALQAKLPAGLTGKIVYDSTEYITSAIHEVAKTLLEALVIVTAVIFLFLGRARAVIIPLVTLPLSLVGTFLVMLMLGYSINLLTLLALVLAIGLVVDDAIIVVENVERHQRLGKSAREAAFLAARELAGPILAMTVVLVAVYIPIGFQGGLTGALFTEFAFTLAGAVTLSGIVALTLSPVMCAHFLKQEHASAGFMARLERGLERLHDRYRRTLSSALETHGVMIVMGFLFLGVTVFLFMTSMRELAPQEDQGIVLYSMIGPANVTADEMQRNAQALQKIARTEPEYSQMFQITGAPVLNQGLGGVVFKPWEERKRSAEQLQKELQMRWAQVPGVRVAAFQFPPLPGTQGLPVQFVITTTESFEQLDEVAQKIVDRARQSGMFFFVDADLKLDKPQSRFVVDRDLTAALGLTQQDVGDGLSGALSGNYINYFSMDGRSYRVIPQVRQTDRLNPSQVPAYYFRTPDGRLFSAATLGHLRQLVVPETVSHFQQLNATTIGGVTTPLVSQGEVLAFLNKTLQEVAPSGFNVDYSGASRQFMSESGSFAVTLLFAVLMVFLVLAALFESFRDPLIILISIPMALFGALLLINLGGASLNIYTQVGLVTLMGLISKHGILIVQFANELQRAGRTKREAIVEAASIRMRPILMTTTAMVLGVLPLVLAGGAGAAGRRAMGLVIFSGLSIGTLFTLFVVPAMYLWLARVRQEEEKAPA
ncbi:MAG: multidrug efflux protein [Ferrovum myxofaciens]|uniref:efflux RND transporter permease subunit n=1 Tax=Ferrovum myxofaciens TaxID=416213 RepID=UPI002357307E|nr:efflux RND transporter permease subunit [Ferrovum myxofaciens]QKE41819.1 MAG: multidrug efflux protein [Ferrovum myxofaciens]